MKPLILKLDVFLCVMADLHVAKKLKMYLNTMDIYCILLSTQVLFFIMIQVLEL